MEEDLEKLDALFDSILDEIIHPEKAGTYRNPFLEKTEKKSRITELAQSVSVVMVNVTPDKMKAVCTVMTQGEQHKPFTADEIKKAASAAGVFYGMDDTAVFKMAAEQTVNTEVVIASGLPAVNGTDGSLHLRFDVTEEKPVPNIPKDTEICHIVSPKLGRDGMDVYGHILPAVNGKPAEFGIGEGLYKKGTRVYAARDGKLILRDGKYCVTDELVIDKNIDQSTGIVGYGGTIIINGNVSGRGIVRAGGSVIVNGVVSNAVIEAEENIVIEGRSNDCSLSAKGGDVRGSEFEEATIVAGGRVEASVLQNCMIKCVNGIECSTGFGRIAGGEIYSVGDVNCLTVGSREHIETHITLGDHTEFSNEIERLEKQMAQLDTEIAKINDQVNDIREKEKLGTATLDDEGFLEAAIRVRTQKLADKHPLTEKMKKFRSIVERSKKSTLRAKTMIYGGAILKVCGHTQILNSDRAHATVYSNGTNIVVT